MGQGEKTQQAIQLVLKNFLKSWKAPRVQDVTAHDVAAYWQFDANNSPTESYRTAHNRLTSLGVSSTLYGLLQHDRLQAAWA